VIAASNLDLAALVDRGLFRSDLLPAERLPNRHPALAGAREDIPQLTEFFLSELNRFNHRGIPLRPSLVTEALQRYGWPATSGNCRT
jgi:DNA-binding NtrC family response regulator